MRFAELTLERYGRFEGCNLSFRSGEPDLHLIYGANEAGKSTTLSAVTDLLFGFPARSPFNFRFDYPLLRIGAVLEEDGRRFACRRRKAQSQTLVGTDDRPIDEGPLLAMLRGQDRDRFRLGFSLDQARLREGGRAMVEAKDDLGQALFAAGSGMTGLSAALASLEAEADTIWGRRAASRRLYTTAERQHEEAQRKLRDLQLKPRAWTDARTALDQRTETLSSLERERAAKVGERRRLERLRRIGPDVRRRTELLNALETGPSSVRLSEQAETATHTALSALEAAERAAAAAAALIEELDARADALDPDATALTAEEAILALVQRQGAQQKADADLVRLRVELQEKRARDAALRAEVGVTGAPAQRLVIARLRDLAGRHGKFASTLTELRASTADVEARLQPLRLALADTEVADGLSDLVAAVEAARALGEDLDARCAARARELDRLEMEGQTAFARLAPWSGPGIALAALPAVAAEEIESAYQAGLHAREDAQAAGAEVARADEEQAALAIERRALAEGGQAIAAERITQTRTARDRRWTALRGHLIGGPRLSDIAAETEAFQAALAEADTVADQRFALAQASGRLGALDARAAAIGLAKAQAEARENRAWSQAEAASQDWADRIVSRGFPALEPLPFRTWMEMRRDALAAAEQAERAREALDADVSRRAQALRRLAAHLPESSATDEALSPMLERAGRLRTEGEARNQRFRDSKAEARQLEDQLADLGRRIGRLEGERSAALADWNQQRQAAGLDFPVEEAEARLAVLEELRTVVEAADELQHRIDGIERDTGIFIRDVHAVADGLGQVADADPARRLEALRARLSAARSLADARKELETTRRRRQEEFNSAQAARNAALTSLVPRLAECDAPNIEALPAALEASRVARRTREELATVERRVHSEGDGYGVAELAASFGAEDPDTLAGRLEQLDQALGTLDARVTETADAVGSARRAFEALESGPGGAEAAADAALARAEMDTQAETYVLKRAETVVLRWAVERYRERRQNPLLARASEIFRTLTLGRYLELKVDHDAASPRLLGLCEDRASLVDVEHMSEGTSDQLYLALRLAAVEQAIAGGVRLPFLADDLLVNFDDERARAGLEVLAELARSTQVLVFTHHQHVAALARQTVHADVLSECRLD